MFDSTSKFGKDVQGKEYLLVLIDTNQADDRDN